MRAGLAAAAVLIPALAAGAAHPCSPALQTPGGPERGEGCSVVWRMDEIRSVALGSATDLGSGRVLQYVIDGNACYWEHHVLVHDCARGEASVIGPENVALMDLPREGASALDRAVARIEAAGAGLTLEEVEAAGRAAGMTSVFRMKLRDRLNVNGKRMGIDCACKTFYPGLKPGK